MNWFTKVSSFTLGIRNPKRFGFTMRGDDVLRPADYPIPKDPDTPRTIVRIKGPGSFISGEIFKKGGDYNNSDDKTIIFLIIDGEEVIKTSFKREQLLHLTQNNPYGVAVFGDDVKTMTIGFPIPLYFKKSLLIRYNVRQENVDRIVANVVYAGEAAGPPGESSDGLVSPDDP